MELASCSLRRASLESSVFVLMRVNYRRCPVMQVRAAASSWGGGGWWLRAESRPVSAGQEHQGSPSWWNWEEVKREPLECEKGKGRVSEICGSPALYASALPVRLFLNQVTAAGASWWSRAMRKTRLISPALVGWSFVLLNAVLMG